MKKQIVIEVSPTGEIKIEAVGFNGKGCEAATKAIEDALGTVGTRKRKPEFNRDNQTNQRT
jgi:hypothetical protein